MFLFLFLIESGGSRNEVLVHILVCCEMLLVLGGIVFPQNSMLKSQFSVPQNVTIFGGKVFKEVTELK